MTISQPASQTGPRRALRIGDRVNVTEYDRQVHGITGNALTVVRLDWQGSTQYATITSQIGDRYELASAFLTLHESQAAADALAAALARADTNAAMARRERNSPNWSRIDTSTD